MNLSIAKKAFYFLTLLGVLGLAGCSSDSDSKALTNAVKLESELNDGSLITSLEIQGSGARIRVGESFQLLAFGTDLNGTISDSSLRVFWQSADTSIATVDQTGLVTAISNKIDNQGFLEISVETLSGVTATSQISINDSPVTDILVRQVAPLAETIFSCIDSQFEAVVTFQDGLQNTVTSQGIWSLEGSTSATIDSNGLVHTNSNLAEQLSIKMDLYEGSSQLSITVVPGELRTLRVFKQEGEADPFSIEIGQRLQLKTLASLSADISQELFDISYNTNWSIENSALAGISSGAINQASLLALKSGDTKIITECSGISGTANIQINGSSDFDTLSIDPAQESVTLNKNDSVELKLLIKYTRNNSPVNIAEFANWSIDSTDIVSASLILQGTDDASFQVIAGTVNTGETIVTVAYDGEIRTIKIIVID